MISFCKRARLYQRKKADFDKLYTVRRCSKIIGYFILNK